jgi:predicted membrane protein
MLWWVALIIAVSASIVLGVTGYLLYEHVFRKNKKVYATPREVNNVGVEETPTRGSIGTNTVEYYTNAAFTDIRIQHVTHKASQVALDKTILHPGDKVTSSYFGNYTVGI